MNRRGFLQSLLGGAIALHEFDIEKALWTPGKKTIFIPAPETVEWITIRHGVPPLRRRMLRTRLKTGSSGSQRPNRFGRVLSTLPQLEQKLFRYEHFYVRCFLTEVRRTSSRFAMPLIRTEPESASAIAKSL